jgi:hypothetical protein
MAAATTIPAPWTGRMGSQKPGGPEGAELRLFRSTLAREACIAASSSTRASFRSADGGLRLHSQEVPLARGRLLRSHRRGQKPARQEGGGWIAMWARLEVAEAIGPGNLGVGMASPVRHTAGHPDSEGRDNPGDVVVRGRWRATRPEERPAGGSSSPGEWKRSSTGRSPECRGTGDCERDGDKWYPLPGGHGLVGCTGLHTGGLADERADSVREVRPGDWERAARQG